ncbi:MAG: alpha/beta hydrolase [Pseudorhodoplanes sp.]
MGLNVLTGVAAAILAIACILPTDHGIIATAKATGAENLAIPLPRPRPVIRVPRPRLGSFPGQTRLMEFESAPFPYDGKHPVTGQPFFNVFYDGRFGRRGARGQVYWENDTYTDPRVLLHIPKGFDIRKPAVIVVFFHGHGARIDRDVRDRQQVAAQITRSDANAVLVAPQFAVDAADSSPGAFWEPGFFDEFLSEASEQFALMLGQPKMVRTFFRMPIVFVSYSGGFVPTAWALRLGHIKDRLRGIVLMDSLYGELEHFEKWILSNRRGFFISGYLGSTRARNLELKKDLTDKGIPISGSLEGEIKPGSVVFIAGHAEDSHRDYVTQAWTADPIADILNRLPAFHQ